MIPETPVEKIEHKADINKDSNKPTPEILKVAGHLKLENEENTRIVYGTSRKGAGCVDITLEYPPVVLKGIITNSDTLSAANEFPPNQKFEVLINARVYKKLIDGDSVSEDEINLIKANPIRSQDKKVDAINAPDPVSPIGRLWNGISGNMPSFAESLEELNKHCALHPPKSLAQYIAKIKETMPNRLRLIPPAANIKKSRYAKSKTLYKEGSGNIQEGPVVEVGLKHITIKTDNGTGIRVEGKTTSLSGTVLHEKNTEIYPQQITGVPSQPFPLDDFIPKGTIVMPHTKRAPAFLAFIQSLLPIIQAVDLSIKVINTLNKAK